MAEGKETGWLSVTNMMRLQQITMVKTVLETKTCHLCSKMIDLAEEMKQDRYTLRTKELKIAWTPRRARTGSNSSWFKMIQTFNICDMLNRKLPRTKVARRRLISKAIMSVYGMSHKP